MKFKYDEIKEGTRVVFNTTPDATVFEVTKRDGLSIMVREHGTDYAAQRSDVSLCHKPTAQQLRA